MKNSEEKSEHLVEMEWVRVCESQSKDSFVVANAATAAAKFAALLF